VPEATYDDALHEVINQVIQLLPGADNPLAARFEVVLAQQESQAGCRLRLHMWAISMVRHGKTTTLSDQDHCSQGAWTHRPVACGNLGKKKNKNLSLRDTTARLPVQLGL
jgi:hypothetical protein